MIWLKKIAINTSLNGLKTRPKEDGTREYYNEVTGKWVNFSSGEAELLWSNASPTSVFSAQTISLDLSNYDYILIEGLRSISYPNDKTKVLSLCPKGQTVNYSVSSDGTTDNGAARTVTVSNAGVTFSNAHSSGSTQNYFAIPLKIYGCNISF